MCQRHVCHGLQYSQSVFTVVDTHNRFRWAVCQVDTLQGLKHEHGNIEKALRNLPKTLKETYDRILLAIPEAEVFAVHDVLN